MACRFLPLLAGTLLALAACSQEPAVNADENAAFNEATAVGETVRNSVAGAIDGAENAVDAMVGSNEAVNAALAAGQTPGWGGDADAFTGKGIALDPIRDAGSLYASGEMGCNFVPDGRSLPVLVAKAEIDPGAHAVAVVANDGIRTKLASAVAGGFGALAQGTRLVGKGVTADVKLTSRTSLMPVGQQSSYPASLTVTVGKERRHIFAGRWFCGIQK